MLEVTGTHERPAEQSTPEEVAETIRLMIGYCLMFRERHPLNDSVGNCSSEESAYFLELEKEYLGVPRHLQYQNIESHIAENHRPPIKKIWNELIRKKREFDDTFRSLQIRWDKTPFLALERFGKAGRTTSGMVEKYPQPVPRKHKSGIIHTITPSFNKSGSTSRLRRWQIDERALRQKFYTDHRDYMVTLRLYYELLLEENEQHTQAVISHENPLRKEIEERNSMARVVNAVYQSVQMAKGAHHEQTEGRLRKYEGIPYAMHTLKVALAALLDTLPFTDKARPTTNPDPVLLAAAGALHDTVEDTALSLKTIMEFLANRSDVYDSSIDPKIQLSLAKSGDEDAVESFKRTKVNLIDRPDMLGKIEKLLRILTDNGPEPAANPKAPLSKEETKTAIRQNLFGEEQTLFHLGLLSAADMTLSEGEKQRKIASIIQSYDIAPSEISQQQCETAEIFQDDHDGGKLTRFLIRANAIAETGEILQHALILKFEDRANNLITKPSDTNRQKSSKRRDLRNAVERLVIWGIYDHDSEAFPLYNSLPRLIHTCLAVYKDLEKTSPELIEAVDREYMEKLEIWARGEIEITRFQTSGKVMKVLSEYSDAKQKDPKAKKGMIFEFMK